MKIRKFRIIPMIALILGAIVLSACSANVITAIKADGAGTYTVEMGFSSDELQQLKSLNSSSDFCQNSQVTPKNNPPNAKFRQETRNGETWCVYDVPFANIDELKKFYSSNNLTVNKLEIKNGVAVYDISLDMTSASDQAASTMDVNWIVTMPGMVTKQNATSVKGNTLTWKLKPGVINNIHAESNVNGLTYTVVGIVLFCLCCLGVLLVAGLIFFLITRNKNSPPPQQGQPYALQ